MPKTKNLKASLRMKNCEDLDQESRNCVGWTRAKSYGASTRMKISVDLLKIKPCKVSMAMYGRMV